MKTLRLDFCSYEAARFAVMRWHYSHAMPCGKLVRIGVWEGPDFVGAVIFGRGASPYLAQRWGLVQGKIAELVRVALAPTDMRENVTSKIVAVATRMIRKCSPGIELLVSFADFTDHDHIGTIYQALGWKYVGVSKTRYLDIGDGKESHVRGEFYRQRRKSAKLIYTGEKVKHYYVLPCSKQQKDVLGAIAIPYPRGHNSTRAASVDSDTPSIQGGEGGATPTAALHPFRNGTP